MDFVLTLKNQFKDFLRSTSKYPSTNERYEMILNHCKIQRMQLRDGVIANGMTSDNKFHIVCEKGHGYAVSLLDTSEVSIVRAWYDKGSITEKHHHKIPTVEHLCVVKGHCTIYLLDHKGNQVIFTKDLKDGDVFSVEPGVKHIVSFLEDTEMVISTIPKDGYND